MTVIDPNADYNTAPKPQQTQPTSQVAPPTPSAPPVNDKILELLSLLAQREARVARKEEDLEIAKAAKDEQRKKNSLVNTEKNLLRQARCTHLKGGKNRAKNANKDYAVYHFTYINAVSVIRCFLCRMEWRPGDTVEKLIRKGKTIANHTKKGWFEALEMLQQSTNTPASSEVVGSFQPSPTAAQQLD